MLNIEELKKELVRMQELEESASKRNDKIIHYSRRNHNRLIRATKLIEDKKRYDKAWAYQEKLWKITEYSRSRAYIYSGRVEALENLIKYYTIGTEEVANEICQ